MAIPGTKTLLRATAYLFLLAVSTAGNGESVTTPSEKATVKVLRDGSYLVSSKSFGWNFGGSLPSEAQDLAKARSQDMVGTYQQISFSFTDGPHPMKGFIRLYDEKDVVLFSQTSLQATVRPPSPFPNFTHVPQNLFQFSYRDTQFSPPVFDLEKSATPWLFFDASDHAAILSAASHFPIADMVGDGKAQIACGFNPKLQNIPAGFTQQSVLALSPGINHDFDLWGQALLDWEGKKRPPNDADTVLKYLGYWTDNGAAYWYQYDQQKGYQGTLEELMASYRREGIPFGYLQLDSWWYHKTLTRYDGKTENPKNKNLPDEDWNRYGGTTEYKAHPFIFPEGMEAFHKKVALPFVTHNRWIDPTSPYHERYRISGIAAIDPGFWDEVGTYLHDNGVICYEQDWLSKIFEFSPELNATADQGEAFLDNMAAGCQKHGLSMQYCMAPPRCFLQGSKYENLTSIRTCGDHFVPAHYRDFFYVSKLADALGIWPFADVFQSTCVSSALFSTLSAGPVGSGDAIGKENKDNLLKIVRADGVIIKPDVPLVAMDQSYLAEAQKRDEPTLASTYTDHDGLRTYYLAACKNKNGTEESVLADAEGLGASGPYYLFDYFAGTGAKIAKGGSFPIVLRGRDFAYYIAAPIGLSGIALLGDAGSFVGTGKKRIPTLQNSGQEVKLSVLFAEQERKHHPTRLCCSNPNRYGAKWKQRPGAIRCRNRSLSGGHSAVLPLTGLEGNWRSDALRDGRDATEKLDAYTRALKLFPLVMAIEILAHRSNLAGPDRFTENSVEACRQALAAGFGLEIDLRRDEAGQFYISHDAAPHATGNLLDAYRPLFQAHPHLSIAVNVKETGFEEDLIALQRSGIFGGRSDFYFDFELLEPAMPLHSLRRLVSLPGGHETPLGHPA